MNWLIVFSYVLSIIKVLSELMDKFMTQQKKKKQ